MDLTNIFIDVYEETFCKIRLFATEILKKKAVKDLLKSLMAGNFLERDMNS